MVTWFVIFHKLSKYYTRREQEVFPYKRKVYYAFMAGLTRAIMYLF